MKTLLSLAFVFLSAMAFADEQELRLPVWQKVFTLKSFGEVSASRHCFGRYAFRGEFTGGTELHLFPNGRFVISEWTDIGPNELRATGTYHVKGDRLTLTFSRIQSGHEKLKKTFSDLYLLFGRIEEKNTVTDFEVFIFPAKDFQMLKTRPEQANYLRRKSEYNDWEKILRDYETQKK